MTVFPFAADVAVLFVRCRFCWRERVEMAVVWFIGCTLAGGREGSCDHGMVFVDPCDRSLSSRWRAAWLCSWGGVKDELADVFDEAEDDLERDRVGDTERGRGGWAWDSCSRVNSMSSSF